MKTFNASAFKERMRELIIFLNVAGTLLLCLLSRFIAIKIIKYAYSLHVFDVPHEVFALCGSLLTIALMILSIYLLWSKQVIAKIIKQYYSFRLKLHEKRLEKIRKKIKNLEEKLNRNE